MPLLRPQVTFQLQSTPEQQGQDLAELPVTTNSPDGDKTHHIVKVVRPEYQTASPLQLLRDDLKAFLGLTLTLPFIVLPLWHPHRRNVRYPQLDKAWMPQWLMGGYVDNAVTAFQTMLQGMFDSHYMSGEMDELYPSIGNLICLAAHTVLIFTQTFFLVSLPFLAMFPATIVVPYILGFVALNYMVCFPLNAGASKGVLRSQEKSWEEAREWDCVRAPNQYDEEWLYLNGVSVGKHWMQGNLNRLARTFRRPVTGVHNATSGIIFDLIQCLLERCFYYGSKDTRECYALIATALANEDKKRVVLIVHSQGGIESSIIVDWLLSHASRDSLKKLEIYTFGNAANHYNNPMDQSGNPVIGHVEHYGNKHDFVARWGVLGFKDLIREQDRQLMDRETDEGRSHAGEVVRVLKESRLRVRDTVRHLKQAPQLLNDAIMGFEKRHYTFYGTTFTNPVNGHLLNQHYLDSLFPLNEDLTAVKAESQKWHQHSHLWKYINGQSPQMVNGE
ncbi:hypothetical protein CTRI78_v009868 [Colletotrichum trifolii]|uniref:Uncharacterized protein n=1 Tax=Colletotrichum trifolii TaxID=5466 RepID=A0A4R8QRG0_COLTR|nr:hypothetical protein CTRI78_v009868 [Colletotrichum trifolii]